MDAELEALVKAYDAFLQVRGAGASRLWHIYESRLDYALARRPKVAKESLHRAVQWAYRQWVRAQSSPPTLPPKA